MSSFKMALGPFIGGVLFALGLGISGMTEPARIIGFLDIFGNWDPSLVFVMLGAIGIHASFYFLVLRKGSPLFAEAFYLPQKKTIEPSLLIGAAIFGIGWGITGLCPGPGLVSLVSGKTYAIVFVASLVVGALIAKLFRNYTRKF